MTAEHLCALSFEARRAIFYLWVVEVQLTNKLVDVTKDKSLRLHFGIYLLIVNVKALNFDELWLKKSLKELIKM